VLEFLIQGIQSVVGIFYFVFFHVKDLCDKIVEFHEDRHNRNCISSVSDNRLDNPHELTIPSAILVEELHFQWQQRARFIQLEAEPEHINIWATLRKMIKRTR
jgi:hypothetical protein